MSQPWGHPQQPGWYPPPGPGQPPPVRPSRRALFITLAVGAVVAAVAVVGVGLFGLAKRKADAGLEEPKVLPPVAAPPSSPLPARRSLYPTLPASCSLLTSKTVQVVYPGATAKENTGATSDRNLDGLKQFSRMCSWEFVTGDFIRFVTVRASGMSGDEDAEDTITHAFRAEIARLGPSFIMPKVDGRRSPKLGSEATLLYGSGGETCRMARVLVRSRNVRFETTYGGCDRKPGQALPTTPIEETTAINGSLAMARDVLLQINKT